MSAFNSTPPVYSSPPPPKTPAVRAAELQRLVKGSPQGWLRLGKLVLALETKWTAAKRKLAGAARKQP
jgi:hypothetical protein